MLLRGRAGPARAARPRSARRVGRNVASTRGAAGAILVAILGIAPGGPPDRTPEPEMLPEFVPEKWPSAKGPGL
jgi:hypothetical protein